MGTMTAKEYAQHRGVNPSYVAHLKKKGFLNSALIKQPGKKRVLIDSEKADKALEKDLDANYRRAGAVTTKGQIAEPEIIDDTFIAARTLSERYRASDRKLNYEIKQGKWMLKSQVRADAFKAGRIFRDAMLNIPYRIQAIVAAETDEFECGRLMTQEIEAALRELVRQINQMTVE